MFFKTQLHPFAQFFTGFVLIVCVGVMVGVSPARVMASEEQSLAVAQRIVDDLWNGANLDSVHELYAERFYTHAPSGRIKTLWTPETWRSLTIEPLHIQYPDLEVVVHQIIADDDMAVVHFRAQGLHSGDVTIDRSIPNQSGTYDYRNIEVIPATGSFDIWNGTMVFRFADGKVVEEWWYLEGDTLLRYG